RAGVRVEAHVLDVLYRSGAAGERSLRCHEPLHALGVADDLHAAFQLPADPVAGRVALDLAVRFVEVVAKRLRALRRPGVADGPEHGGGDEPSDGASQLDGR